MQAGWAKEGCGRSRQQRSGCPRVRQAPDGPWQECTGWAGESSQRSNQKVQSTKKELKIATDWLLRGPLSPAQAGRRRQECSGRAGLITAGSGQRAFRCNARCYNFATALSETRESVTQIRRHFLIKTGWVSSLSAGKVVGAQKQKQRPPDEPDPPPAHPSIATSM